MSDLPKAVSIHEEGPREGFQIERGPISTGDKIRFVEALAETGVKQINCVALVNPKKVPGWADAEEVAKGIKRRPGVSYTGLWLNQKGIERARQLPLDPIGIIQTSTSETFALRNTNMTIAQTLDEQRRWLSIYKERGIALDWGYVMTAFGCAFEGEIPIEKVVASVGELITVSNEAGLTLKGVKLADTVGHGTPVKVQRVFSAVREAWPDLPLGAHFHDTRGTGIANAWAALSLGVAAFDSSCAGLGGCPFAGNSGAAGNISTEDFVYMCEEMGVATGIDLGQMVECARMAEAIVGHPLPSKMVRGFSSH